MSNTLKLGFAMGGGVSLGSFSGSALTESIKLAIIYAKNDNDVPYDHVKVDVFSGASAGAMSLGIMLKALAFPDKDKTKRQAAWSKLKTKYFDVDLSTLSTQKQISLIDAQLAQDLMHKIWVDDIHIDRLLAEQSTDGVPALKYQCGILNKSSMIDIARESFLPPKDGYQSSDKPHNHLLSKRVLYGCSIANLNPLYTDAKQLYVTDPSSNIATNDALTSQFHKEMRVFDINFEQVTSAKFDNYDNYPTRWVRFHWGKSVSKKTFDVRSNTHWKHIVATATASGAFPFAFEPVSLTRYKWEYPDKVWPFGSDSDCIYSYVDGGLFNNEPVAEAFKLASHIDALDHSANYDRRIIFVDPNVGDKPHYILPGLHDFKDQAPLSWLGGVFEGFDGNDLIRLTSLDKLLPHALSQFAASGEEGEAKEEHRTFQVANKLIWRDKLRRLLQNNITPNNEMFIELKKEIGIFLSQMSDKDSIPTMPSTLAKEIERLACEKDSLVFNLKGLGNDIEKNSAHISDWPIAKQKAIMIALVFSYIDLISGLSAKSRNSQLIAVGPFEFISKTGSLSHEKIPLPGSAVAAFAGFMSPLPSHYETEVAKYCVFEFMKEAGLFTSNTNNPTPLPKSFAETEEHTQFMLHYKAGMEKLDNRIVSMVKKSHLLDFGYFSSAALSAISSFVKGKIAALNYEKSNRQVFEFRVEVGDKDFELDGKKFGDNDRHAIRLETSRDKLHLVCFAQWDWDSKDWHGYFLSKGKLVIYRDTFITPDKRFLRIPLPNEKTVKQAVMLGYPVFWNKPTLKLVKDSKPTNDQLDDFWVLKNEVSTFSDLL
jgi:predicted acylesterase/phospholipase RssA